MQAVRYLNFELSDGNDGISTLDALAATRADQAQAVRAEAQQVLDWARQHFGNGPGPVEDGHDWDHALSQHTTADGWHELGLTLSGTPAFVAAFVAHFGEPNG